MFGCKNSSVPEAFHQKKDPISFSAVCISDTNKVDLPSCLLYATQNQAEIIFGVIKNNNYDTVALCLYKTTCAEIFAIRPDQIDYYYPNNPSRNGSDLIYTATCDTIIKIQKNEEASFVFFANCANDSVCRKLHRFSLVVDSFGLKKGIVLSYAPKDIK